MIFYRIFVWLYPKMAFLLGFWNRKARVWHTGRTCLLPKIAAAFASNTKPVIWVHCASLGEFEQGLPVMEALRKQYTGHLLLVTFFSPSGYEIRKDHPVADLIFYLPMDSEANATRFFDIVKPALVLFIKYEFWFFYLREAHARKIPLLLVSGIFRKGQSFFAWYGSFQRKILRFFTALFVQDDNSAALLKGLTTGNIFVCGDTRFDRVIKIATGFEPIAAIDHFCAEKQTLVAGSTWTDDDEELDHFANTHPHLRCIIVPHEIEEERLKECLVLYKYSMLYSDYQRILEAGLVVPEDIHVLIIDNVGMLSRLYKYATVCYVGGGFGDEGVHNILEAAVYGKPVVFGPVFEKYIEAVALVDKEAAFCADDALELEEVLRELFDDDNLRNKAGAVALSYIAENAGATQKVMDHIQENRLLTS